MLGPESKRMQTSVSLNSNLNLGVFFISRNSVFLNCLKFIFLIFLIKVPLESQAQLVSPNVISVASLSFVEGENSYSFSIGESLTSTLESGNIITQGFLQPKHQVRCTNFTLVAYPNPTPDLINLRFEGCDDKISRAAIIDIFGKVLFDAEINGSSIDLSEINTGIYFIKVFNNRGDDLGVVKIAKVTR